MSAASPASAPAAAGAGESPAPVGTSPAAALAEVSVREFRSEVSEERLVAEVSETPVPPHVAKKRSAGRNLPAAIGVGVALGLVVVLAVFILPVLFTPLVAFAVVIGALEVTNALERVNLRVPAIPLLVASVGIVVSASVYGATGVLVSTVVGAIVLVVWRVVEATGLMALRDTVASIFTLLWVPFLASFAVVLMNQEFGPAKILLALAVPVANDVGGYVAGVFFGRHPMAPSISPKKSWEGFAGSLLFGVSVAGLITQFILPQVPLALGLAMGAVMVLVATIGDLCESLLKRDLGIKDMGQLLPGHGGLMDRLDSMLLTAPTLYIMLTLLEVFGG